MSIDCHGPVMRRSRILRAAGLALATMAALSLQPGWAQLSLPLTQGLKADSAVLAPDGKRLLVTQRLDGRPQLFLKSLDGHEWDQLTRGADANDHGDWSPGGGRIVHRSSNRERQSIRLLDVDTKQSVVVYAAPAGVRLSGPRWSPNGRQIAFNTVTPSANRWSAWGRSVVATMNVDGSGFSELTSAGDEWWPSWTPDGHGLIYYQGNTDDLDLIGLDGAVRQVSAGRYFGWRPAVSPDGLTMAFLSEFNGSALWLVPMDGSDPPTRLPLSGEISSPRWKPDGRGLTYTRTLNTHILIELEVATGSRRPVAANIADLQQLPDGSLYYRRQLDSGWSVERLAGPGREPSQIWRFADPILQTVVSPDGAKLAWVRATITAKRRHFGLISLDGQPKGWRPSQVFVENLLWCDDGESLIYSAHALGRPAQLYRVSDQARSGVPLSTSPTNKIALGCDPAAKTVRFRTYGADPSVGEMFRDADAWVERAWSKPVLAELHVPEKERINVEHSPGQSIVALESESDSRVLSVEKGVVDHVYWSTDRSRVYYTVTRTEQDIWHTKLPQSD